MGLPVLILGQSGTGKSASLRNCDSEKTGVVNVAGKPLPFKNKIESVTTDDYSKVKNTIKAFIASGKKTVVVDDAQYLMGNEFMRRAMERGYDKFTEIGRNFWDLINAVKELPSDAIVYFFAHVERDQDGNEKIKTIGKLLDEKITVEGMFTIVLKTNVTDGQYSFLTQNNGHDTTKSPIGMFPTYAIDNDLHYVDEKIRNYYELGEFLSDEDIAEIDKAAAKVDFTPKQEGEKKSRKRRGENNEKEEKPTETPAEEKKEEAGERTAKRRRANDSVADERVAVEKENAEMLANAGIEEAGDSEEVPFEEVETPDLKEMPRRKKRGASNESKQEPDEKGDSSEKEAIEDEKEEKSSQEDDGKVRSRRSRIDAHTEDPLPMNPPVEESDGQSPRRRRRR